MDYLHSQVRQWNTAELIDQEELGIDFLGTPVFACLNYSSLMTNYERAGFVAY